MGNNNNGATIAPTHTPEPVLTNGAWNYLPRLRTGDITEIPDTIDGYIKRDNYLEYNVNEVAGFTITNQNALKHLEESRVKGGGGFGPWSFLHWTMTKIEGGILKTPYGFNRDWAPYARASDRKLYEFAMEILSESNEDRFFYFSDERELFNTGIVGAGMSVARSICGARAKAMFYEDRCFLAPPPITNGTRDITVSNIDLSKYEYVSTLKRFPGIALKSGVEYEQPEIRMNYAHRIALGVPCLSVGDGYGNDQRRKTVVVPDGSTRTFVHPTLNIPIRVDTEDPILKLKGGTYTAETGYAGSSMTFDPLFGDYKTNNSTITIHANHYIYTLNHKALKQPKYGWHIGGGIYDTNLTASSSLWESYNRNNDEFIHTQSLFRVIGNNNYIEVILDGINLHNISARMSQLNAIINITGDNNRVIVRFARHFSCNQNFSHGTHWNVWAVAVNNGVNNKIALELLMKNPRADFRVGPVQAVGREDGLDPMLMNFMVGYFKQSKIAENIKWMKANNVTRGRDFLNCLLRGAVSGSISADGDQIKQIKPDLKKAAYDEPITICYANIVTERETGPCGVFVLRDCKVPDNWDYNDPKKNVLTLIDWNNRQYTVPFESPRWDKIVFTIPENFQLHDSDATDKFLTVRLPWGREIRAPLVKYTPWGGDLTIVTYYRFGPDVRLTKWSRK